MKIEILKKACAFAIVALALAMIACSRGKEHSIEIEYAATVSKAIDLCTRIEALRCSSLGLDSSDTLSFYLEDEDLRSAIASLEEIERSLFSLPAARLSSEQLEKATIIAHWAKGERFVLEELATLSSNPLLYARMLEIALWEMPTRFLPPNTEEANAYRLRLRSIPSVVAGAKRSLRNPSAENTKEASSLAKKLIADLEGIKSLARRRYGDSFEPEFDIAGENLEEFQRFLLELETAGSRGRLILGVENLSKIFLCGELLEADPNVLVSEAETRIVRLSADRVAAEKRIENYERYRIKASSGKEASESIERSQKMEHIVPMPLLTESPGSFANRCIDSLWSSPIYGKTFAAAPTRKPKTFHPVNLSCRGKIAKFPLLSLAQEKSRLVMVGTPYFGSQSCMPYVLLAREIKPEDANVLRYELLCAAPSAIEARSTLCERRDTVSVLFGSEMWFYALDHLARSKAAVKLRSIDPELYISYLDEEIRLYSLVIVVIKLHAGTLTLGGAVNYLSENTRSTWEDATRDAIEATISPSIAYPGIARILVERMLDKLSEPGDPEKPRDELRNLFLKNPGMPLALIEQKLQQKY